MNGDRGEFGPLFRANLGADRTGPRPSGWWRRVAARLVDSVLLILPMLLVELVVRGPLRIPVSEPPTEPGQVVDQSVHALPGDILLAFLLFAMWVGYETFFLSRWGQTPGKMLMGIKVVPASDPAGTLRLPASAAATRSMLLNLFTAVAWAPQALVYGVFVLTLVAMLWPLLDFPRRQGLHDKLVATMVVRAAPPLSGTEAQE